MARRYPQTEAVWPARNRPAYLTQMEILNLRSDRGQAGHDPIAKVGNPVEKRSHRNQYTKNPKKGEGQSGSKRKIQPNWKCAHTGKDSDQLGKNAGTSHKEPWQTERGRRETTTPLRNGLKANPTNVGKATSRLRTEQEHRLCQRQLTKHADYAHHQTPEARGTAAPLWPANKNPTKKQGNNHRSGAMEVGQLRKKTSSIPS